MTQRKSPILAKSGGSCDRAHAGCRWLDAIFSAWSARSIPASKFLFKSSSSFPLCVSLHLHSTLLHSPYFNVSSVQSQVIMSGIASDSVQITGGSNPVDKDGLCLLSLDGGGVRGLSSLYVLKSLMDRFNSERTAKGLDTRKPCEIFDLIGGTSTGGYIRQRQF
jgi:hypothetical protein